MLVPINYYNIDNAFYGYNTVKSLYLYKKIYMFQQPKKYVDHLKYRRKAHGVERRRNLTKIILEHGTPFCSPIEYSDIDTAMFNWLDNVIDLSYNGKRIPTYKLFSTQRISEYGQTWKNTDEKGDMVLNFKSLTRENNPQHGENQGQSYNIPGHRDYAMFYVPVLNDNGTEAFDKYTMKQPFAVNFLYKVAIITNSYEMLNEMNQKMLYEFNAINCYLDVNGHPMPMTLESISDESEYAMDDWKYYAQTFDVKVKGYIIRREDYKVERIPSRMTLGVTLVSERKGMKLGKPGTRIETIDMDGKPELKTDECGVQLPQDPKDPYPYVDVVEEPYCPPEEEPKYYDKIIKIIIDYGNCTSSVTFVMDKDVVINTVETENVYDFKLIINCTTMSLDNEVEIHDGDEVTVKITRSDLYGKSVLTLVGYDPNSPIDANYEPESQLDEAPNEEDIYIEPNK